MNIFCVMSWAGRQREIAAEISACRVDGENNGEIYVTRLLDGQRFAVGVTDDAVLADGTEVTVFDPDEAQPLDDLGY